ncbi:MAG: hypothetical protein WAO58_10150 [Fimbriimonadaceae bacterium]
MQKKHLLMIGISVGALFLGKKLYQIRKNKSQQSRGSYDNAVDLTSADSFPASDAPSWSPVQAANARA